MSRAATIWFVTLPETGRVRACFTVKHELATFLDRHPEDLGVWRIPDGHWSPEVEPVQLDRATLTPVRHQDAG